MTPWKRQGTLFDVDKLRVQQKELEAELELPEVWGDLERSTQVSKKLQQIKNKLAVYDKTVKAVDDVEEFLALIEEENDESYAPYIERDLEKAEKDIEELRLQPLLRGKYDGSDAI